MVIEDAVATERTSLLSIAVSTGLFSQADAESLLGGVLDALACRDVPEGHQAVVCRAHPGALPLGWAYFAPDQHASNIWHLWWIGVSPAVHGTGVGKRLLHHVEALAAARDGRVLVIETSDSEHLARARRFYRVQGYTECGRIPNFYAEGEAKVIFARRPRAA